MCRIGSHNPHTWPTLRLITTAGAPILSIKIQFIGVRHPNFRHNYPEVEHSAISAKVGRGHPMLQCAPALPGSPVWRGDQAKGGSGSPSRGAARHPHRRRARGIQPSAISAFTRVFDAQCLAASCAAEPGPKLGVKGRGQGSGHGCRAMKAGSLLRGAAWMTLYRLWVTSPVLSRPVGRRLMPNST